MSAASSSPAPSPQQSAAAKSSRVCLNCRRKKKRCDKALPSCGRCTYSLQVCQHEDDIGLPGGASMPGPIRFESFMDQVVSPTRTYTPVLEHLASPQPLGPRWSILNPSLFASMDANEDISSFACRCLSDILGHRQGTEHIVASYFSGVNTWFTIIERASFDADLKDMWAVPSAETAVLTLCMRLITRTPNAVNPVAGMGDSLYLSAKTMLSLVQSKVALSIPLLQAELLVAMYEFSHSMPQQAYMTVGRCFQISRAFGWHHDMFWSEERQSHVPRELKLCSILWWAIVYVDCLVHVSYQDQKYPMHAANLHWDFSIPFPESFDQYLPGSLTFGFQGQGQSSGSSSSSSIGYLDANIDHIDGMVWPEATSAWYLSNVLQQLGSPTPATAADRNMLSGAITAHTINVLSGNWKRGDRTAAVGTNFIALMKVNQPGLISGSTVPSGATTPTTTTTTMTGTSLLDPASATAGNNDPRPVETIRSVISSIYSASLNTEQAEPRLRNGGVAPCGAFSMYYASLLLISHGGGVLQDGDWLRKVEGFKRTLEAFGRRWKIADRYVESINIALGNRLGNFLP
ncbi:hypothetical protein B0T25DRAFT_336947 [Lasiosphaeria hispida]|uniref:Zn(2)-C6 fungal-type domain-containing protein n=1 Tax=Lasiosphaeria hispida TaxID=260671 RepID=A0AAJ0M858_9PEZI|nr:hypothetical protein B0T25DRAFT_336947 [Lasiosphaeria hispida]